MHARVYICQNATLLEISCTGSNVFTYYASIISFKLVLMRANLSSGSLGMNWSETPTKDFFKTRPNYIDCLVIFFS